MATLKARLSTAHLSLILKQCPHSYIGTPMSPVTFRTKHPMPLQSCPPISQYNHFQCPPRQSSSSFLSWAVILTHHNRCSWMLNKGTPLPREYLLVFESFEALPLSSVYPLLYMPRFPRAKTALPGRQRNPASTNDTPTARTIVGLKVQ